MIEALSCPWPDKPPQACELCGRPCFTHSGLRWAHQCCVIEMERWGNRDCVPCASAEKRLTRKR